MVIKYWEVTVNKHRKTLARNPQKYLKGTGSLKELRINLKSPKLGKVLISMFKDPFHSHQFLAGFFKYSISQILPINL